jgi:hypothetical protein
MEAVQERSLIAKNCKLFCTSFLVFSFVHKGVPPYSQRFLQPVQCADIRTWSGGGRKGNTVHGAMNEKPLGDVDEMQYISSRSYTSVRRSKQRHLSYLTVLQVYC